MPSDKPNQHSARVPLFITVALLLVGAGAVATDFRRLPFLARLANYHQQNDHGRDDHTQVDHGHEDQAHAHEGDHDTQHEGVHDGDHNKQAQDLQSHGDRESHKANHIEGQEEDPNAQQHREK